MSARVRVNPHDTPAPGYKARLRSEWVLECADGTAIDLNEVLVLLEAVDDMGSIAEACRLAKVSYRHGWGVLRAAEQQLRCTLIETSRRRGSTLTPFARQLIWANRRVHARLAPTLESMSSELQEELDRFMPGADLRLKLHASHGFAVEGLLQLANEQGRLPIELRYRTGSEALVALAQGECHLAGFQVPVGVFEGRLLRDHAGALDPDRHCLVNLSTRKTGLIVQAGNPLGITSVADLARNGIRFVNRQKGSSTRSLVDYMFEQEGIDPTRVRGYETSEFTHMAIAAHVASGIADVGIGIQTAAWRFGLDFVPLVQERYFLAANKHEMSLPAIQAFLHLLADADYRDYMSHLVGYDASALGSVQSVHEAFPDSFHEAFKTPALGL
ncbi:MAG TPA: substrate-binding domain-containing protein [Burkholderiaceae bacterium]|nr:substrate-binding domain-containing protein [Burkholderiaceae bacterium]